LNSYGFSKEKKGSEYSNNPKELKAKAKASYRANPEKKKAAQS